MCADVLYRRCRCGQPLRTSICALTNSLLRKPPSAAARTDDAHQTLVSQLVHNVTRFASQDVRCIDLVNSTVLAREYLVGLDFRMCSYTESICHPNPAFWSSHHTRARCLSTALRAPKPHLPYQSPSSHSPMIVRCSTEPVFSNRKIANTACHECINAVQWSGE